MPKRGFIIGEVSRSDKNQRFCRGGQDHLVASSDLEAERGKAYAVAFVNCPDFHGCVDITLSPEEVKLFNRLETKIVERMQREVIEQ